MGTLGFESRVWGLGHKQKKKSSNKSPPADVQGFLLTMCCLGFRVWVRDDSWDH